MIRKVALTGGEDLGGSRRGGEPVAPADAELLRRQPQLGGDYIPGNEYPVVFGFFDEAKLH